MLLAIPDYKNGMCGVTILHSFRESAFQDEDLKNIEKDPLYWGNGGCNYLQAGFISDKYNPESTKRSQKVYDALKKRFPIIFESEKRINKNSGNLFWFCIYDMSKPLDK